MCDRGIDALVRSYSAARNVGLHEVATFELWLEGPIADASETVAFVNHPAKAASNIRTKIIGYGLKRAWLDDFLQRLVIQPDQPPRSHIDAKAQWEISALWPALSRPEIQHIYERLLMAATAAQSAAATPATVQAYLAAARPYFGRHLPELNDAGGEAIAAISNQLLSHTMLVALTPPLPDVSVDQLLTRMSVGSAASLLELKMTTAGARPETIRLRGRLI